MNLKLPTFTTYQVALREAGVDTASARGFWGGVSKGGDIVLTTWIDAGVGDGRFQVWKPRTRHGGLMDMWDLGRIEVGATVRLIILRPKGHSSKLGEARSIHSAGLTPGRWRVAAVGADQAVVEPV